MESLAKVGIVADDLTGAIETAAAFVSAGRTAKVATGPDGPRQSARSHIFAINTRTRGVSGPEVWDRLALACTHPGIARAGLLYKKIDSTLRGDPVHEVICTAAFSGSEIVILSPALPSQRRTFVEGKVYVDGMPLALTEYANDLQAPAQLQSLKSQFEQAMPRARVVEGRLPPPASNDPLVWIADAESHADLLEIAAWGLGQSRRVLFAGSAGLARALSQRLGYQKTQTVLERPLPPQLFVLGSRSERTRRQAGALEGLGALSISSCQLPQNLARTQGALAPLVLRPPSALGHPNEVAKELAAAASALIEAHDLRRTFACGGDTAVAVLDGLGVRHMRLLGEVFGGVFWSRFRKGGRLLDFFTKAGGHGEDQVLRELLEGHAGQPFAPEPPRDHALPNT